MGVIVNQKGIDKKYSSFEACLYGMERIFEHNATEELVHKKVINDLKDHHFDIEEITLVKMRSGLHCDVVAKDLKGYRSYAVTLEKNSKFDHLYRIFDVRGQKITSTYQWKN